MLPPAAQHNSDEAVLTVDCSSNHILSPGLFKPCNLDVTNRATSIIASDARRETGPAGASFSFLFSPSFF